MKAKALLLLLCLCLTLLPGCHGSRGLPDFVPPGELDQTRSFELSFWAKNDTNKAQTRIYEQAIADFQELYPNIQIHLRLYTDYGRIYNDVITNIATQTTPNVCITYPDHIATYLTGTNIVAPLDELLADPRYGPGGAALRYDAPAREELIERFLSECCINGQHYALPYMRSTEACYVNKSYVEALGFTLPETLTWDFVWKVSEAAMAKGEDGRFLLNGQNVLIPFIYKSTDNMMIQYLRQQEAPYATAEGEIGLFSEETRALLREVAIHAESGAFSTFKISSYPANFLNAGQCIFAVDSTAGSTWMGSEAPLADIDKSQFVSFETAVLPVPQLDPAQPRMISQGPSVCVFNKADPQEVLASWLFAQFLLSDEVQIAYAETEGYVPVTRRAQESEAYRSYLADTVNQYPVKLQASQLLLDHLDESFVTPVFPGSASLRDASGQLIESVAKSVRRKETVDERYLDSLFEDVSALYRLKQEGGTAAAGRQELGPLPPAALWLLGGLAAAWVCLLVFVILQWKRKKRA